MTAEQIEYNISHLKAEATSLRENREAIEKAHAVLEDAERWLAFAGQLLELAEVIGDSEGYMKYSRLYCRYERWVARATESLQAACAQPHQWGRYREACGKLDMLHWQLRAHQMVALELDEKGAVYN